MNCEGCLNMADCEDCMNGCKDHIKEVVEDEYFHVGDVIPLKGRLFRVKGVKPSELRLKLIRFDKKAKV